MQQEELFNEEQHNEEMIQKVEAIENEINPSTEEEPKAEESQEEETGEESTQEEDPTPEEDSEEEATEEEAEQAVEEAGLDMGELEREFEENGQLSQESYLALERAGIPKSTVDSYISGVQAQSRLIEMEAYNAVGGEANYKALSNWAADNLSEEEISAFNETLSNPSGAQFKLALQGLQARYQESNGSMTDNLGGQGKGTIDVFESMEQVRVAMSDKRYATDIAYQRQIQDKLMRSNLM